MTRLEHIGIAVSDPASVADLLLRLLGLELYKVEEVASERVTTHFLGADNVKLELLESSDPDSVVGKFLARRGEGIHHLAFEVANLQEVMRRAVQLGLTPLRSEPTEGADGKRIFFLHPKETHGVLIEICEADRFPGSRQKVPLPEGEITAFAAGRPDNPALLLLHDAGGSSLRDFGSIISRLEPRLYVIAFDAPGHGESQTRLPERHFLQEVGRHAHAVLTAFGVDQAVVAGVGLGAAAAADLAVHFPDQVQGLALLNPNFLTTENDVAAAASSIEAACTTEMTELASALSGSLPEAASVVVTTDQLNALGRPLLVCGSGQSGPSRALHLHADLDNASLAVLPAVTDGEALLASVLAGFVDSMKA